MADFISTRHRNSNHWKYLLRHTTLFFFFLHNFYVLAVSGINIMTHTSIIIVFYFVFKEWSRIPVASVTGHSHKGVPWNHTVAKFTTWTLTTPTNRGETRFTYARSVDIPHRIRVNILCTSEKTTRTILRSQNVMTDASSNSPWKINRMCIYRERDQELDRLLPKMFTELKRSFNWIACVLSSSHSRDLYSFIVNGAKCPRNEVWMVACSVVNYC